MISLFKKIWDFADLQHRAFTASLVWSILNAIVNIMQFGALYIVLQAIENDTLNTSYIYKVSALLLVCAVLKVITKAKSTSDSCHAGYFMGSDKRLEIANQLKSVPMGFFNDFSLGKITGLATSTVEKLTIVVPFILVGYLEGLFTTSVFVLSLYSMNIKIALIATAGYLGFMWVTSLIVNTSSKLGVKMQQDIINLNSSVLALVQGMQAIKSYNLTSDNNKDIKESFESSRDNMLSVELKVVPYVVLQRIVIAITIFFMVTTTCNMYIDGVFGLADCFIMLIASFVIFEGMIGIAAVMSLLKIAEASINDLEYVASMPAMGQGDVTDTIDNPHIVFNNVSFSYGKEPLLEDITCEIKPSSLTAIVGPSGSGKTTLARLIPRFWDVDKGEVTINGIDVVDYNLNTLMSSVSQVFQDVYLFGDTIENNIKFGRPEATHEEVVRAAKACMCHEFIEALPDGYDTYVGEAGVSISGGERQRLSIARAVLKDAPIIIFDEATANIDPENEDKLALAIKALTKDKTIIMIAHKLKTIRSADQILVLDKGRIQDRGTHEELIERDGIYKNFIEARNKACGWKLSSKDN